MKKTLLPLIFAFLAITTLHTATAQTYDPYAVQVINNLIANNGLQAEPNAPETWKYWSEWNDSIPKQLIAAYFSDDNPPYPPLFGEISFGGLTTVKRLDFSGNRITKLNVKNCIGLQVLYCNKTPLTELNVTNCTSLQILDCRDNSLTEFDLTSCMQMSDFMCCNNKLTKLILPTTAKPSNRLDFNDNFLAAVNESFSTDFWRLLCDRNNLTELCLNNLNNFNPKYFYANNQKVSFALYGNEIDGYTHSILLNNPTFGNSAIAYWDNILKSTDNTVSATSFTTQTGKPGFELSGTMSFTYSNVGISMPDKNKLKVYPNPTTGELTIDNGQWTMWRFLIFMGENNSQLTIVNCQLKKLIFLI